MSIYEAFQFKNSSSIPSKMTKERSVILTRIRRELHEDYVGVWQIARILREAGYNQREALTNGIVDAVATLLVEGDADIGQFQGGAFRSWQGAADAKLKRLRDELIILGTDPDIGEIAWLVAR